MNGEAGKGDARRPSSISEEEKTIRWGLAFGQIKTRRVKNMRPVKTAYGTIYVTPDLEEAARRHFAGHKTLVVASPRKSIKITRLGTE